MHTKHSLLIINFPKEKAYAFVQLSDLAKNWHISTPIIVNISIPPPLGPKTFDIQIIFLKRSKPVWLQNWIGCWGVFEL